jgi:hypothetical protein
MLENYKDAIVRHRDPSFIKRRLTVPEAAGRNVISTICCNFWFVKHFAEPLLNTTSSVQNLAYSTTDCVHYSRAHLSCSNFNHINDETVYDSRFDDERKARATPTSWFAGCISKSLHYAACLCSYFLIMLFIYASFTL